MSVPASSAGPVPVDKPVDTAPRVDVGMVTWNTRDLSVAALRRLLDSEQDCELRVLVHDNASADGTAEAVRDRVPEADVETSADNLGFAAAVNRLFTRSDAPWFLMLNSDAWPQPGALRALVDCAVRHPRAACVAPRLERPDGSLEHSTHPFPSLGVAAAGVVPLPAAWADRRLLHGGWRHDRERAVDWAVGAAWLLRREAVEEVGRLDETFFMYVEDLEWCHRAHRLGRQVWFTPDAVVVHVGNASGEQRYGDRRTAEWMANSYRFYRRHHGAAGTGAYRLTNATAAAVTAARAAARRDRGRARFWWRQVRLHLRSG